MHPIQRSTRPGRTSAHLLVLLVASTLLGASCGHQPHAETRSESTWFFEVDGVDGLAGGLEVKVDGISVDVDESVHFQYRRTSTSPGGTQHEMTVEELPMSLEGGVLTIGTARFEGLVSGDSVVLSREGIRVNGERRWDWPADGAEQH